MNIVNNTLATMSLGELNKNINQAAKNLAKLSSGQKINSAADGASEYAISRRMQVRTRALEQDSANVHTGMNLLKVAMGGVQEQINIMKLVKERVIDAANDSNSDADRQIIQKEITSCFEAIDQIACETADYNRRKVLMGGDHWDWMMTWTRDNKAEMLENSDMAMIPDVHDTLDNVTGPFDLFEEYRIESARLDSIGIPDVPVYNTEGYFTGGQRGNPNTITVDFSPYANADALDNVGFLVGGRKYVLTKDPGQAYAPDYTKIDISGCTTTEDVAAKVAELTYNVVDDSASGSVVTFSTRERLYALTDNAVTVTGAGYASYDARIMTSEGTPYQPYQPAGTKEVPIYENVDHTVSAGSTGLFGLGTNLAGGENAFINPYAGEADAASNAPAKDAVLQRNISGAASGSGFTINGPNGQKAYVMLKDGTGDMARYKDDSGYTFSNVYTIGKSATWSGKLAGLDVSVGGGNITFQATGLGRSGNRCSVSDEFSRTETEQVDTGNTETIEIPEVPEVPGVDPTYENVTYTGVTALQDSIGTDVVIDNKQTATDATYSTYTIDLSSYVGNTNSADLENLIADLYGKAFSYSYAGQYEFIDSSVLGLGSVSKLDGNSANMNLNDLRSAVRSGTDIATALANMLNNTLERSKLVDDGNGNITGVELTSKLPAEYGWNENISGRKGSLRSYTIDFKTFIADNQLTVPGDFMGKGFRVYCPTDSAEWFNFLLMPDTSATEYDNGRPESGTGEMEIKSIIVDISKATDAASLVTAIYEQAQPILTGNKVPEYGANTKYNHFLRVAANPNTGELILYDERKHAINYPRDDIDHVPGNDRKYYPDIQEAGEKIADGAYDNVTLKMRELFCEDIIIHHTDKASMNIHIKLPRTTIDQVLGYDPALTDLSEYNVLTKASRDWLLGTDKNQGIIDRGIKYLTNSQVVLGAQYNHLESAADNITVQSETTMQSESTMADADMAKEAAEHAKYSILSQSSQAMLAQANQISSNVLNLLQ